MLLLRLQSPPFTVLLLRRNRILSLKLLQSVHVHPFSSFSSYASYSSRPRRRSSPSFQDNHIDAAEARHNDKEKKKALLSLTLPEFNSESDPNPDPEEPDPDSFAPHRHAGIRMHPKSISNLILPGNVVKKLYQRSGTIKRVDTDYEHGYFWMLKDLDKSKMKPIVSNTELIPEALSQVFPTLSPLRELDQYYRQENVQLPDYFLQKNRSRDPYAQCTIVGVAFRDFGYTQLQSWLEPFQAARSPIPSSSSSDASFYSQRIEIVRLNMTEGWVNKWILRHLLVYLIQRKTPPAEKAHTLLYMDNNMDVFRDALRMHNSMVGYVFLLDGLGRVRFAGSGPANADEVQRLQKFANQLIIRQNRNRRPQQQQQQLLQRSSRSQTNVQPKKN